MLDKKHLISKELSKHGFKLTNQRKIILDIVLSENCSTCKEIFYLANKEDPSIGIATVYRTLNILHEVGIIDRKNQYKLCCNNCLKNEKCCSIVLKNNNTINISKEEWHDALIEGLRQKGYFDDDEIERIILHE